MSVTDLDSRRVWTIGGSEAAAACGVSRWTSRVELWLRKRGELPEPDSEAIDWGNRLQPVIFAGLVEQGYPLILPEPHGYRDPARPWFTGHPDGFTVYQGEPAVLEVKTSGLWQPGEEDAPRDWIMQAQQYMALTGRALALLACLHGGHGGLRLTTVPVLRDDALIARMLELEEEFVHYLRRETPPPAERAGDALLLYPEATPGKVHRFTQAEWARHREIRARREQLHTVKEQLAALEEAEKAAIGDAEVAISPHDEPVARWTQSQRTSLDLARLKSERPDLYQAFSVTRPVRRFTVQ